MSDEPTRSPPTAPAPADEAVPPSDLILPHRGLAILAFGLVAGGLGALAGALGAVLRLELLSARDPEGELMGYLALIALIGCLVLAWTAWMMATNDLRLMAEGRMDAAGRRRTVLGKSLAVALVLAAIAAGLWWLIDLLMRSGAFVVPGAAEPAEGVTTAPADWSRAAPGG